MPVARTIAEARPLVAKLVERFRANRHEYTPAGSKYNETALRTEFLNPLLQALGWDVENEDAQIFRTPARLSMRSLSRGGETHIPSPRLRNAAGSTAEVLH